MLILNKESVAASLTHADCIDIISDTMKSVSRRDVVMPLRQFMAIPESDGKLALMPGYLGDPRSFGVKIVSKFPRKLGSKHGSHVGAVMVFDATNGLPLALLDGGELTAIRTSSASALATRELARADAKVLTLMGCGEEAYHHICALSAVRALSSIIIWGRDISKAQAFAESKSAQFNISFTVEPNAQEAVTQADIICTVTSSQVPVLKGSWLKPGVHVNLVGAAVRTSAEADDEVVARSRFFVDYRESAMAQAGELLNAIENGLIDEDHIAGEIGEVLDKRVEGRTSEHDITVYKSLGVSAQDLAAGVATIRAATEKGIGVNVDW